MTDVQLYPGARVEPLEAATYYEEQSEGLGGQFIDEAQRVFDLLAESPGLGSPVPGHDAYRRWSLRRFPYRVIYRENKNTLFVLAVAHERRRPRYWWGGRRQGTAVPAPAPAILTPLGARNNRLGTASQTP